MRFTFLLAVLAAIPAHAEPHGAIPHVPEPMVFDMVRAMGARAGELEVNVLGQANLSGPNGDLAWAPEVEWAVTDGFAVELELPMVNWTVMEYKLGLQGTFGTLRGGKAIHGVQYLGIYDRADGRWHSSLLYLLANRINDRWSTMTMVGVGGVTFSGHGEAALLVNQSVFYDAGRNTVTGVEVNYRSGHEAYWLVMPQIHQRFGKLSIQAGIGAEKERFGPFRPRAGLRVIKEF